jgi:non-specific serine/threonine protein kinase/serine/threonine-protein kinase
MKAERWRQIEDLVDAALECEPAERAALLDRACAGDADLRREVESLLAHQSPSENFIEAPAFVFAADLLAGNAVEQLEYQHLGPYKILREIGRGGMGAVFLAERSDGEFQQKVALKLVRRGFAEPELTRRFRRERQILASLNHPNIARLFDGGVSDDGEPFLVMEYVEGARIDAYCDEHNLSTEERLKLFLTVCQGVAYAHQNLIVHRDIKPSNVLVTTDSTPKLLDFGIAKLLDAEHADEHTETNFRAFTPDYAAPEQIRGEQITTASDVYSLGVLLHDLLHGARHSASAQPAPGLWRSKSSEQKTVATNLPTKQEGENGKAKVGNQKFVGSELKNIIAMARREEPARRYASVAQFAEDIQRYLDGLPVRAQKDSFTYRTGKFVRRNKVGVGASALVALSLIIGTAFALWQARVAQAERDRAERRFSDVRQLSNALLIDIVPKIERLQGSTEARQAIVNQSLKYLDSLARESGNDLQLQSELASAYEKVGDLQGTPRKPNLSDFSGAIVSYEKAQAIRHRLLEKNPDDVEKRRLLAANHNELSNIRFWMDDLPGAVRESEAAQNLYEKLVAEQPGSVELRLALAETYIDFADISYHKQQFAETYPYLRKVLSSLEEVRLNSPADRNVLYLLGKAHTNLGIALSWDGKQSEGEAEMAKALAINEALLERDPNDVVFRNTLWSTYIQASSLYEEVNDALSESFALKALRLVTETVEKDPANIQARQNLAKSYSKLSASYINTKRLPAAVLYAEKALTAFADLERAEPQNLTYKRSLGIAYTRLGDAKYRQRDLQGSLDAFEKSIASFERIVQADPQNTVSVRDIAQSCKNIGHIHRDLAQSVTGEQRQTHLQEARRNYQRALDILLKLKSQNAFAEVDKKFLEEMQSVTERMSEK